MEYFLSTAETTERTSPPPMADFKLELSDDSCLASLNELGVLAREPENRKHLAKWIEPIAVFLRETKIEKAHGLCYRALANIVIDDDDNRNAVFTSKIIDSLLKDLESKGLTTDYSFQSISFISLLLLLL